MSWLVYEKLFENQTNMNVEQWFSTAIQDEWGFYRINSSHRQQLKACPRHFYLSCQIFGELMAIVFLMHRQSHWHCFSYCLVIKLHLLLLEKQKHIMSSQILNTTGSLNLTERTICMSNATAHQQLGRGRRGATFNTVTGILRNNFHTKKATPRTMASYLLTAILASACQLPLICNPRDKQTYLCAINKCVTVVRQLQSKSNTPLQLSITLHLRTPATLQWLTQSYLLICWNAFNLTVVGIPHPPSHHCW